MKWDAAFLYERIVARDRTYDGRFLTGVLTTGIYCLPSCPARKPRPENVRFFRTIEEAEAVGLRPCQRCRPVLFYRGEDWDRNLFTGLVGRVRADLTSFPDTQALARTCGISTTKLNDLFREQAHKTPSLFLRQARVRAACDLLLGTTHRIVDIAHEAGFESESAFHRQFLLHTRMTPGAYRGLTGSKVFFLHLPTGYRPEPILAYHGRDPQSPSERVSDGTIWKALVVSGKPVVLEISIEPDGAWCRVHDDGQLSQAQCAELHSSAVRMLGLRTDPGLFEGRVRPGSPMQRLVQKRKGLRIPLTSTVFEALTWAIVGQQINLSFAGALRRDLISLLGERHESGMQAHPTPERVAQLEAADLIRLRFSKSKAEYLINTARVACSQWPPLESFPDLPATEVETRLLATRGLGPWTTHYVMLRGCGLADCLPVGDSGLSAGIQRLFQLPERPTGEQVKEHMQPFTPFRSLATCHLWASLRD